MSPSPDHILCLARIQKPFGVRGQLKATAFGDLLEFYHKEKQISFYSAPKVQDGFLIEPVYKNSYLIQSSRFSEHEFVIQVAGIMTVEAAQDFKGLYAGISLQQAKAEFGQNDQPYLFQYIFLDVLEHGSNQLIGKISRIENIGRSDIFVIEVNAEFAAKHSLEAKNCEVMIAANCPQIISVDFSSNCIVIENLEDFI